MSTLLTPQKFKNELRTIQIKILEKLGTASLNLNSSGFYEKIECGAL